MDRCLARFLAVSENLDRLAKAMGYEKILSFFVTPKSPKVWKNSWKNPDWAPLNNHLVVAYFDFLKIILTLMQPSMGTLNSPSSRVVKDSTPSRRRFDAVSTSNLEVYKFRDCWIFTYLIFGHGESSPNNNWSMVNLERTCVLLFYYFL